VYGFVEQLLHYFNRPHVGRPAALIGGRAAWMGKDIAGSPAWREQLSESQVREIERAVGVAKTAGRGTADLRIEDFPFRRCASPSSAGATS